jgi:general L-amino acid transport system permease protein
MNESYVISKMALMKPPAMGLRIIRWLRRNLFSSPANSFVTIISLYLIWFAVSRIFTWAVVKATWIGPAAECKDTGGACWNIITSNIRFILFGFYPYELHWRPFLVVVGLILLIYYSKSSSHWKKSLIYMWLTGISAMWLLLHGGILGLDLVPSSKWSGLPLTLMVAIFGVVGAYPIGVIFALARQSKMPAVKILSIIYIEVIRGVPLISLLFVSSVVFPLFLPERITINKIIRAQAVIILFFAAYIAEVVRGGLQAIPKGQYEAAKSLGLGYGLTMWKIILPQALKIVIPPTVSILISAFKDTSLVVIIALYDILNTTQSVLSNPEWMGYSKEAYIFLALFYFAGCFAMSNYSRKID